MSRFNGRKWPRYLKVWEERKTGKTYRELEEIFGVCGQRCRYMVLACEEEESRPVLWHEDLKPRTSNALIASGYDSREKISEAIDREGLKLIYDVPNFGLVGYQEILEWLK